MTVKNDEKQTICQKHDTYLRIIYKIGNKVLLLKQLFQYAEVLGLARSYKEFLGHIHELAKTDIIRQEQFVAFDKVTQLHMITLRKYAIRYVEGKSQSYEVGAVPVTQSNERIITSIFKNSYVLDRIVPRIVKVGKEVTLPEIEEMLAEDGSSILYSKGQALDYLCSLDDRLLESFFDTAYIQQDFAQLQAMRRNRDSVFLKGSKSRTGKGKKQKEHDSGEQNGKQRSTNWDDNDTSKVLAKSKAKKDELNQKVSLYQSKKAERMAEYSINNMLNGHIYVSQIKHVHGLPTVTLLVFDIHNKQDVTTIAQNIACAYLLFQKYMKGDFKLKVGVVALDAEAKSNMERESNRLLKDWRTRDFKGSVLQETLKNWGVDLIAQKNIEVVFTDYDITNRYLDGIKYLNLVKKLTKKQRKDA